MDVLRRFSSTGSIQAVKPIQRSRPDAPLQSSQGQIFQDLESRWDASAFEVEKTRCCSTLNISFLLALIVLVSTTSAALVIWGVMYGLNDSGYSELSESLQQNQVEFVVNSTNAFLELYTRQLVTVSEFLRVQWVKKGFIDVNDALEVTLAGAKAIASNCYVYYAPNRTFHGHGRSSVDAGIFVTFLQPNETGAYIYQSDSKGHALAFSQFVPKFDATQRPWYLTAFAAGAMSLSPIYPYADLSGVGTGFAVPVYRDGLLVANRSCSGYDQLTNMFPTEVGPASHRRELAAMVGVDVDLRQLSAFLSDTRGTIDPDSYVSWIFANDGVAVSFSSPQNVVGLVKIVDVDDPIIQQSMQFLIEHFDANETGTVNYAAIDDLIHADAVVDGVLSILTHVKFNPGNCNDQVYHVVVTQPKSTYFQPSWDANTVALLVIFLALVPLVVALTWLLSSAFLSRPTRQLASSMDKLTHQFEYTEREKYSSVGEIQTMQRSFDSMAHAIKSFSKFAPIHLVKSLLWTQSEATLGVEDVDCTVFFSDIASFTSISESVAPDVLVSTLAEYFNEMSIIIEAHNGMVLDYLGDAIFAVFTGPDHAYNAMSASVEQQERLEELRAQWQERTVPVFEVRMGVNSGHVLIGNVGSTTHMKFTCLGDNVNLAARLEGLSRVYGTPIVAAASTFDKTRVREEFVARHLDYISVLGKQKPTVILTCVARRETATERDLMIEQLSSDWIEYYMEQSFEEALKSLKKLSQLYDGKDESCRRAMARIQKLIDHGVPEDFQPHEALTHK